LRDTVSQLLARVEVDTGVDTDIAKIADKTSKSELITPLGAAKYIVSVQHVDRVTHTSRTEYLCAIRYDRYQNGNITTHSTVTDVTDAFKFRTLAAAEMAAVFVGGDAVVKKVGVQGEHRTD